MKVAERLARREPIWRELDTLLLRLEQKGISRGADPEPPPSRAPGAPHLLQWSTPLHGPDLVRLAELYRAACADLMLAEAHDLPRDTVESLHSLVARAHNALYRSRGLRFRDWGTELFGRVPRRLRADPLVPIAAAIFYGAFFIFGVLAATRPGFAELLLGDSAVAAVEDSYSKPPDELGRDDAQAAGFYINNNAGIGLMCFGAGLSFGLGTIYILFTNGMQIGTLFGHMLLTPHAANFYNFVTAHAPFELTAIVFSGAAGLRLGWGLIHTQGQSRLGSLQREARNALPTAGAAVILFVLAAFLEGFVSASSLPYFIKAALAVASALVLLAYVFLGGRGHEPEPQPA